MGMPPPAELLAAAGPAPGRGAARAAGALGLPVGAAGADGAGYEELLSIQQHQHSLALQHKDAEAAHLRRLLAEAEERPGGERLAGLAEALRTKDEEAALMMAAKHKELELMASLLQLREQQIEDLRQLCEAQQSEIQQLRRRRALHEASPGLHERRPPPLPEAESPAVRSPEGSVVVRRAALAAGDDHAVQLEREVRRLRLKMEEMESAIAEQHQRSAGLAQALERKSERVKALEEQVKSLHSPGGTWPDSEQDSGLDGRAAEPPLRPSPPPNHRRALALRGAGALGAVDDEEIEQRAAQDGGFVTPNGVRSSGSYATPAGAEAGRHGPPRRMAAARSMPRLHLPHAQDYDGIDRSLGCTSQPPQAYLRDEGGATLRRDCAGPLPPAPELLSYEGSQPSAASQQHTYRSAIRVDVSDGLPGASAEVAAVSPEGSTWHNVGPSEAAETGRQSQELWREMRRLRMQMSELERAAGARPGGSGARAPGRDSPGASLGSARAADAARVGRRPEMARCASAADGLYDRPAPAPREPLATNGALAWGRPAALAGLGQESARALGVGLGRSASSSALRATPALASGASAATSAGGAGSDFGGWEYRPHVSGDPTDSAVAALVNQPGGRYRGWRALLCRLEAGVYLCGTRRVRLRADADAGVIQASADGGESWADLEELMQGAEASQRALLERARGAASGGGGGAAA